LVNLRGELLSLEDKVLDSAIFFLKGTVQTLVDVDGGRLDLDRFPLGGGVRRWRVQIQELDEVGCVPGRWATADGFIPSYEIGVFFDFSKTSGRWAFSSSWRCSAVFFAGGGRRRGF
jgi:hypothetical protein